ncbi:dienelactone hydrolase family protein [Aquimarina sp. 2-A2]|uniref:dienelactone hydrolase family protein n=1 Tax=Aquimarina sp. 2-A2 TaxID=3382644 RepID=UPI00387EEC86
MKLKNEFTTKTINIDVGDAILPGFLTIPDQASSIVLFSHGSGSSRLSPRNNFVAKSLQNEQRLATLLVDLLTVKEDQIYSNRFDIDLLTKRLVSITDWVRQAPETRELSIGYFGASTGAASALQAAAALGNTIKAVVCRGGRPDLAMDVLHKVIASTLLIVGELDTEVIELNQKAFQKFIYNRKIEIIKNASHLFEEPGKLQEVAVISGNWFTMYL